jgi:hypothetical protein
LNRPEVDRLGTGIRLREVVNFPGGAEMSYSLEMAGIEPSASFDNGDIRLTVPRLDAAEWAHTDAIGMYFDLPAEGASLRIAIEKDLECVDEAEEERDPEAFPRGISKNC